MRSSMPPKVHVPRKTWFLSGPTIRQWMLALLAVNGVGLLTLAVLGTSRPVAVNRTDNDAVAEALAPLPPVVAHPSAQITSSSPPPTTPTQQTLPKPRATKPVPQQPTTPNSLTQQSTAPKQSASTQSRPPAENPQVKPAQPSQPTINPPVPARTTPPTPQAPTNKPITPSSASVQRAPQSTSRAAPQSTNPIKAPSSTVKSDATPSGTVKSGQPKPDQPKPTPSKPAQPSRTTPPSPAIAAKPPGQNADQPKAAYQEEQAAVKELVPCALVVDARQLWPQFQPSATPNIFSRQGQLLWPPRSLTPNPSEPVPDGLLFFARTEEAARDLAETEPDLVRAISSLTVDSGGMDNEAVVVDDADADRISGLPDHCRVVFLR